MARTLLQRGRGKRGLARDDSAAGIPCRESATRARRSSCGLLLGNDGVGSADARAPALSRRPAGIRGAARGRGVSSRRGVAGKFLPLAPRVCFPQENVLRLSRTPPPPPPTPPHARGARQRTSD